jgi:hypothetical protein
MIQELRIHHIALERLGKTAEKDEYGTANANGNAERTPPSHPMPTPTRARTTAQPCGDHAV